MRLSRGGLGNKRSDSGHNAIEASESIHRLNFGALSTSSWSIFARGPAVALALAREVDRAQDGMRAREATTE